MLVYFHPNDDLATPVTPPPMVDEDFWSGALTRVATIALAATMAVSSIGSAIANSPQDEPGFTGPAFTSEEDIAPYQTVPDPIQQILIFLDDGSSVPAFQADEDYSSSQVVRAVPPIASYPVPLVFIYDDIIAHLPTSIDTDEDFWQNPVPHEPVVSSKLYLPDPEEIPALVGPAPANPIDELWQNPVTPVPFQIYVQFPYVTDPEELPAASLFGQPDEDFWQNPVTPVPGTNWQRFPVGSLLDPDEIPANTLAGQPDEDFWQNPITPVHGGNSLKLPYLPDPDELSAAMFTGLPDEDFWINPVAPIASYPVPKIFGDDDLPISNFDEDFWVNAVAPVWFCPAPQAIVTDDVIVVVPPIQDEDFWQNAVAPVPAANYQRLPILPDPEEIPAGSLVGPQFSCPDEDFWINPVQPVPLTFGPVYLPDPDIALFFYIPLIALGSGKIQQVTGVGRIT